MLARKRTHDATLSRFLRHRNPREALLWAGRAGDPSTGRTQQGLTSARLLSEEGTPFLAASGGRPAGLLETCCSVDGRSPGHPRDSPPAPCGQLPTSCRSSCHPRSQTGRLCGVRAVGLAAGQRGHTGPGTRLEARLGRGLASTQSLSPVAVKEGGGGFPLRRGPGSPRSL